MSKFQSTRPIRGATPLKTEQRKDRANFNPRAPYGARHRTNYHPHDENSISIHAPHTGRDYRLYDGSGYQYISIHAPHTGRDLAADGFFTCYK